MPDLLLHNIAEIGCKFMIDGRLIRAQLYGAGHINETFLSWYKTESGVHKFIHQRLNHLVFKEPLKVMHNIERVTRHIREKVFLIGGDPGRNCLNLIPTSEGKNYCQDSNGNYWRTYRFIDHARTYDVPTNPGQVYAAAKAFGSFQSMLADLPGDRLHESIPDFHNTPLRFQAFLETLQADKLNRAYDVKEEVNFILGHENDTKVVVDRINKKEIPERIVHNDTKLNNVLIDDQSGEGICVIDLDTTMPGSSLYDFGDMVRSGIVKADEDEPDLSKIKIDLHLFEQIARGYLNQARSFLLPSELMLLPFSGNLITLEQAIRFLADYLSGDIYYKIDYPNHNLFRARTQIRLVTELELQMEKLIQIIEKYVEGDDHV